MNIKEVLAKFISKIRGKQELKVLPNGNTDLAISEGNTSRRGNFLKGMKKNIQVQAPSMIEEYNKLLEQYQKIGDEIEVLWNEIRFTACKSKIDEINKKNGKKTGEIGYIDSFEELTKYAEKLKGIDGSILRGILIPLKVSGYAEDASITFVQKYKNPQMAYKDEEQEMQFEQMENLMSKIAETLNILGKIEGMELALLENSIEVNEFNKAKDDMQRGKLFAQAQENSARTKAIENDEVGDEDRLECESERAMEYLCSKMNGSRRSAQTESYQYWREYLKGEGVISPRLDEIKKPKNVIPSEFLSLLNEEEMNAFIKKWMKRSEDTKEIE